MRYSKSYEERVVLDDGTPIVLRAILPTDKEALAYGFSRLSVESRRRRFLSPKNDLSDEELRSVTEYDGVDHYAIGALGTSMNDGLYGEPTGAGVARFARVPGDPPSAELGIVVADAWQHRGIGKMLLRRIVDAAAERGFERIRGETLADNKQIRALLQHHTTHVETHHERGVLQFSFPVL